MNDHNQPKHQFQNDKNKAKKKLFLIITKSNWGGAQRYVYDLACNLQHEFDVIVLLGGNGELVDKLTEASIRIIQVPGLGRDIHLKDDFTAFNFLLHIFKKEKPDIVHLNSSKIAVIGTLAARLARIPHIIFTAHGWAFNEDRQTLVKLVFKITYWFTMLLAHRTIMVSNAMKSQVKNFPFVQRKCVIIKNGVPVIGYIEREKARSELLVNHPHIQEIIAKEPTRVWLGSIAELHPIKGQIYILEALVLMKKNGRNIPLFVLISDGEYRQTLENYIHENNLKNDVVLVGHRHEAAKYMKAFDIFILTSVSEALGYVLLEAGRAELPVIATRVGGIPEVIENNVTGLLVHSRDTIAIKQSITKIESDTVLAETLAKNLYYKVEKEFSIEEMVQKTKQVY